MQLCVENSMSPNVIARSWLPSAKVDIRYGRYHRGLPRLQPSRNIASAWNCSRQKTLWRSHLQVRATSVKQVSGKNTTDNVVSTENQYVLQTYARPNDLVFTHGEGSKLFTTDGREFLDFAAGIAVNSIGHSHPHWVKAVTEQADKLVHVSNLFHTEPQAVLAKRLCESSFADRVFYCNSGTEANEGAIKFARKWAKKNAGLDPYDESVAGPSELVSFHNCFHGRTMGALALTYKKQYKTPFQPVMEGGRMAQYLDLDSAAAAIQKGKTAAVFVEPVQGEGGINIATKEFLAGLRALCDEAGALLVYDEVQCGLGRTGKLWAYENFGVEPDIMTLAKPLAGGLPIGAVLMKQHVADAIAPGDHGSTFAGAPMVCAGANACLDILQEPGFLDSVVAKGERLRKALSSALEGNQHVVEVRGSGLICGVELDVPAGPVTAACLKEGLIVITAGAGNVVRMVPPLVVSEEEVDRCVSIVARAVSEL